MGRGFRRLAVARSAKAEGPASNPPAVETPVVARFVGSGLRSADLESPFAPTRSAPVFLRAGLVARGF